MADLSSTISSDIAANYEYIAAHTHKWVDPLTHEQFWHNPFGFGNSAGHLILHMTGNLNYYIGAQMAKTGYVRDRPREFSDPNPPSKDEALKRFDDAVHMVIAAVHAQSPDDWSVEYSGTGTDARNPLEMVVQCAAHMQHHIGQMIYLGYEWQRQAGASPK